MLVEAHVSKPEVLARFPFYRELSDPVRAQIEAAARLETFPARTQIFSEGDPCVVVPLLGEGTLRVFMRGESGREITLYSVEPGETCLLTLVCAWSGARYPAGAVAESDARAVLVPVRDFCALCDGQPAVRAYVLQLMAERVLGLMALVDEVAFRRMDKRLAEYLVQHFPVRPRGAAPVLETTHERIAAHLGSAREVISRLLKELERLGAVELGRGQIRLCDEDLLRRLSGASLVER